MSFLNFLVALLSIFGIFLVDRRYLFIKNWWTLVIIWIGLNQGKFIWIWYLFRMLWGVFWCLVWILFDNGYNLLDIGPKGQHLFAGASGSCCIKPLNMSHLSFHHCIFELNFRNMIWFCHRFVLKLINWVYFIVRWIDRIPLFLWTFWRLKKGLLVFIANDCNAAFMRDDGEIFSFSFRFISIRKH